MTKFRLIFGRKQLAENNQSEREKVINKFPDSFENNETIEDTEINILLKLGHYPIKQKAPHPTATSTRRCGTRTKKTD